jgi:uncharacterized protein (DUF2147 family)
VKYRLLYLLLAFCGQLQAADLPGDWVTPDGSALIRISHNPNNDSYEGTITALLRPKFTVADGYGEPGTSRLDVKNPSKAQRERPLLGLKILTGLKFVDGKWEQGKIYDPGSGRSYRCHLALASPDFIKMRGFMGFSLLGRTMYLQRAPSFRQNMQALLEQFP